MRTFVVLCLLAVASADKLGYNYQPVAHADQGLSFLPGAVSGGAVLSLPIEQSVAAPAPLVAQQPLQVVSAPAPAAQVISAPVASAPVASAPVTVEYQKEFYTYTAPDNEFDDSGDHQNIVNSIKKNLQVIFIKGPENQGLERAALQLAQQSGEGKTAIYVLQKQADVGSLAQQLQNIHSQKQNQPEVHFVKYRTPQDAQNAQRAIQSQYDQLPGSSRSLSGGVAPVLNFASQAPVAQTSAPAAPSAPAEQYLPANPLPQQNYLPPSFRLFRRF